MKKGKGLLYVAEKIRYDKKSPFITVWAVFQLLLALIFGGLLPLISFLDLSPAWNYTCDMYRLQAVPSALIAGGGIFMLSGLPAVLALILNQKGRYFQAISLLILSFAVISVSLGLLIFL